RVLSWWWSRFRIFASSRRRKSTGMRSIFPQSRKTRTRSTTSTGGSWKTSSSGRKRYSTGSGNSFAARNMTESLPSCSRMWWVASSDPRASPSGPSCVVSRNFWPLRISWATSASEASRGGVTAADASVIIEELGEPDAALRRRVVVEREGRRALHSHLAGDLRLHHAVRGAQARERRLALTLVAEHDHVHAQRAHVTASLHCR